MKKYLVFEEGNSHKFWQIEQDGDSFTVTYGKVGTTGQTQTKSFADEATAAKEAKKLLDSKLKKGYAEAGAPAQAEAMPAQKTPEIAINKAYWELQDGSFFIYMQWGRWTTSLQYQSDKAKNAQPRSVGNLSEESALEDFHEDTEEMLPKKKRDVQFNEIPLSELKIQIDKIAKTLPGKKTAFKKETDDILTSLPPVLPEPMFESVLALIDMVKVNYVKQEAGIPLEELKGALMPLFKESAEALQGRWKKDFTDGVEAMFAALPPIVPEYLIESELERIQKTFAMLEKASKMEARDAAEESENDTDSAIKYYELDNKFWAITLDGNGFTVQFGKIGTGGQTQEKYFDDEDEAAEEAEKLIKSKTKKGYALAKLPASMAKSDKPKAEATPMEAPKPKKRTLPAPAADVKGGERQITNPDDYDEESDEDFALDNLRTPEVIDIKPQVEKAPKPKADAPVEAGYDEAAFKAACGELKDTLKRGRGASAAKLIEGMKRAKPTAEQIKTVYVQATKQIFSRDVWYVSQQALDLLPIIKDAGVDIAALAANADQDDIKPLLMRVLKNINTKSVEDSVTEFYRGIADVSIKQLKEIVAAIKAGTQEGIDGNKLLEGEVGFDIDVDDPMGIYTTIGRNRLARQEYAPADDLKGSVTKRYLTPIIKPILEKMMNEGFFDDIANGYISIRLYKDPEALAERRIDEALLSKKAAELEANLQLLETCDCTGDAELLDRTIHQYCEPNGIITNKDTDRILALLKRCIYSGEEAFEEKARDLLNHFDKLDYEKWRYAYINVFWDNFDYKWAKDAMQRMADEGYQPAKDTYKRWMAGVAVTGASDDEDNNGGIDYNEVYGYGQNAKMAKHRDTFTEADVFCETDTIIARARADGYIYIRFLEESERGYSDALDWLNQLMEKGFSKVHDGYELRVYFLAKPVFFEEMRDMIDEYRWPDNDSHAFFCKAVRYPALRDKVAQFARLTVHEFDHYLDLDGEYSTVAGTFAATAVAMADVKYMDVAIQYAVETDGEHEEMASLFADVLEERWGVTPETAVAIALLAMSYDSGEDDLSDKFWKYPQNLEALTEYFSGTPMHHKEHKICRLGNAIFDDAEDGLKKLKKLFKDSADPKAKAIYADFHNMLLEALEKEEDTDGKAIEYKAPAPKAEKVVTSAFKELPENPACVITMAEAKKRGYKDDNFCEMTDRKGDTPWWAMIFAPVVITNPYIYDFYEANRQARQEQDHMCSTVFNANEVYTFKGKVALDLRGAPYQFGMMVYDKKDGAMLYGLYDYCKVIAKIGGKKIDKAKMAELRDEYMFMESCPQGAPIDDLSNPAVKLMEDARGAIFDERYFRAIKKLEQITPNDGEVYNASLIVLADMMTKKGDKATLKKVYETAAQRMPQYKTYWDEKLATL